MHSLGQSCYIRHPKTGRFRVDKCTRANSSSPDRRGTPLLPGLRARPGFPTPASDFRLARLSSSNIEVPGPDINFCTFESSTFELSALRPRVPLLGTPPRLDLSTDRRRRTDISPPGAGHVFRHLCPHKLCHPSPHTFLSIFLLLLFLTLTTGQPADLYAFFHSLFFAFPSANFLARPRET
jgi:hypothetical protein